jgi:hypothetical protein
MPKPGSDLERYLAGESTEREDVLPAMVLLFAIVLAIVAVL